ncbi:MAG: hypothetical protein ACYST0_01805, partial [Planctomycetota bacterium]
LSWSGTLEAQQPAAQQSAALQAAVDRYLHEHYDAKAKTLLGDVLAMPAAKPQALLAAVKHCSKQLAATELQVAIPHHDDHLIAEIRIPKGHDRQQPRLPVVLDIAQGGNLSELKLDNVITVWVPGYTPPEFSDEGRDGFLKILRTAAHVAHGDPDRMWLCGFSWAAHACYDTAEHRPGVVRGIVPMAGGPRWVHFRVLRNLQGVEVLAFCGRQDDRQLVWNLEEVHRQRDKLGLSHHLTLDPEQGHSHPLKGTGGVAKTILSTRPRDPRIPDQGTLMVDAAFVETPLLRVDRVNERQVAVPKRVPVRAGMSLDARRRATIAAINKKVATLTWTIKTAAKSEKGAKSATLVTLRTKGVRACTVFFRAPTFRRGQNVTVKVRSKTVHRGPLLVDPKMLLQEARRTGERLRPAFAAVPVKL